jgi:GT2 family glycosyltransferase
VDPEFLTTLLDAAATDPSIGMLNPKILLQEHPDRIWSAGGRINWMRTKGWHIGYDEPDRGQYDAPPVQDSQYVTGGCLLLRREVIEQIGFLPEEYFVYYEDGEWSTLAQRAGWRTVVIPGAKIWHKGAASSGEHSASYIRYHVRNGLLFARRTGNLPQITAAYLMSLPRALWQTIKLVFYPAKRTWARAILAGIADAWKGETGFIGRTYTS